MDGTGRGYSARVSVSDGGAPTLSPGAAELLGSTRLFAGLGLEERQRLAHRASLRNYRRGEIVIHEGEPGDALFAVVEGFVKVYVTSIDGDEMVLVTLSKGDTFGELAVIDGGVRSASAQAVEPSTLLVLTRESLLGVLRDHPAMAVALLRSVGRLVRRLTDQASDLVFLDLHGRVAKYLCTLCDKAPAGARAFDLHLTQGELASMVGGSRQSVNQILRSFEEAGIVQIHGREVLVRREDLLRRRAGLP